MRPPARRAVTLASAAAVISGALAACGEDLSLDVRVVHPEGAAIARTAVSIYESGTTACKDIELGDLSAEQLRAILAAEAAVDAGRGTGALSGIARAGRKLVVARGFDAEGRLLAAGCAQHEEITGRDAALVETEPAAAISIGAPAGEPGIPITLTDALGRALPGHAVSWRVHGAHGAEPAATAAALATGADGSWELAAPACTGAGGAARLHPVPPSRVGGYAIALRPRWAAQPAPLLTSFTPIDPTLTELFARASPHPCAIRVAGAVRRLVCLQLAAESGPVIAREYELVVEDGNGRLVPRAGAALDPSVVSLFSVERSATVRDVYAIGAQAQVFGVFGPSAAADPAPHLPAGGVDDAVLLPACAAGEAAQLLVRAEALGVRRLYTMPPLGGPLAAYRGISVEAPLRLAVRAAGCVSELRPDTGAPPLRHQAAIIEIGTRVAQGERAQLSVVFECERADRAECRVGLPVASGGAGLSPPPGPAPSGLAEEARITGVFVDASGVVMSSWVLVPAGGGFALVERGRVASAALPNLVVHGHFDGDGATDMFWDLPNPFAQTSTLQVTYGRAIGGAQRLSALSGANPILVDDLLAGDLTGDGIDDIVLSGRQPRGQALATGLIAIPMGVPIPNPDPGFDAPCP